MASAGTVSVEFQAETARFTNELRSVNASLKGVEKNLEAVRRAVPVAAIAAAAVKIASMAQAAAQSADLLGKTSDKLGVATQNLKAFQIAAGEAGVGLQQANKLLVESQTRLGQAAAGTGEAAKYIKALGLNIGELQSLSPDQLFRTYADAINGLSNRSEQLAAANALMGESAREAFSLIQAGAPALDDAAAFTERFGLALDRVDIKQIEQANDALGRVSIVSQAAGERIAAGLAPAVEFFAKSLLDATGNTAELQARMEQFSAVAITAFEIISNGARTLEAAFYGIAAAGARVLQALTFGDVSAAFAASVDANLAKANDALLQIKSIEQIQESVTRALEDSRARAQSAVDTQAAQNAAAQAGGVTLGSGIGLDQEQQFSIANEAARAAAEEQKRIARELSSALKAELQDRAEAARNHAQYEIDLAERRAQEEIQFRHQAIDAGIGAFKLLATNSKTFGKLSKALDIAAAIRNTYVGVTNQLKSGDPYTATARAAAVGVFGAAQIAALSRTPDEASYGTVTTIRGPIGAPSSGFSSTSDNDYQQQGAQSVSTVQVIIQGNVVGNREFINEMIDSIKTEISDRDVVIIQPTSRQAQELLGV